MVFCLGQIPVIDSWLRRYALEPACVNGLLGNATLIVLDPISGTVSEISHYYQAERLFVRYP